MWYLCIPQPGLVLGLTKILFHIIKIEIREPRLLTLCEQMGLATGLTPALFAFSGWHTWLLLHAKGLRHLHSLTQVILLPASGCRCAPGLSAGCTHLSLSLMCFLTDTGVLTQKSLFTKGSENRSFCTEQSLQMH